MRVFEKRVLRRKFGAQRDEVTVEWRELQNEVLNDLYSSPNFVWVIKYFVELGSDSKCYFKINLQVQQIICEPVTLLFELCYKKKYTWDPNQYRSKQAKISSLTRFFYVHVTVHCNKFLFNKTKYMHQFHKFVLARNATCFGQFFCPSSGVYSL